MRKGKEMPEKTPEEMTLEEVRVAAAAMKPETASDEAKRLFSLAAGKFTLIEYLRNPHTAIPETYGTKVDTFADPHEKRQAVISLLSVEMKALRDKATIFQERVNTKPQGRNSTWLPEVW